MGFGARWRTWIVAGAGVLALGGVVPPSSGIAADGDGLWAVYQSALKGAKYVDLTHTITPTIPVWAGFAGSSSAPAKAGSDVDANTKKGDVFTYAKDGFEATEYVLRTDQLGTQLDPPAHWAPEYPAIDELPPTYAIRPLVVIPIAVVCLWLQFHRKWYLQITTSGGQAKALTGTNAALIKRVVVALNEAIVQRG